MPVTWTEARREMLRQDPALGRVLPISSLTTTTVVVSSFAPGGIPANVRIGDWLVRGQATAAADIVRRITNYASSTGTYTHAGTNYSDTTATGEYVEVLRHEPWLYNVALRDALMRLSFRYETNLPGINNRGDYGIADLVSAAGLMQPVNGVEVRVRRSPGLIRNRNFGNWYTYQSDGKLLPDFWTPSTTATVTKAAAESRRGGSALSDATTAGVTYTQTGDLLINNAPAANNEDLRGQAVTFFARVKADAASQIRLKINDGVTTTSGSYNASTGVYEEVSVTKTLAATATKIDYIIDRANAGTTAVIAYAEAFKGSTISDALRRDAYPDSPLEASQYRWNQGAQVLSLPAMGQGGQYVIAIARPYGVGDNLQALIESGAVDSSQITLPVANPVALAWGAISSMYEAMAGGAVTNTDAESDTPNRRLWAAKAAEAEKRFQRLAGGHLYKDTRNGGMEILPTRMLAPMPRRQR